LEIITGTERRRRWGVEEKLRIVAESPQPGATVAEIARRHEVSHSLIWAWRRQVRHWLLRSPLFLPVRVTDDPIESDPAYPARLLEGESMSALCRESGISRKTGYKIFSRYKAEGVTAISDRSRRPWRYANQLPSQLEALSGSDTKVVDRCTRTRTLDPLIQNAD
jgi:Transposase/leucine-zipper of insertion element IS481